MLTAEANERLTATRRGTAAGELLRRYWMPVAAVAELGDRPTHKVRVLGEDLVVFRDGSGGYGLIQERCAHRGCSLAYGLPDARGLRCSYHGWLYSAAGACLEQPAEPAGNRFKDRIKVTAYPVEELGGLLYAYLGPLPAPVLPRFDVLVWPGCLRHIGKTVLPVNWVQVMENSVDPVHLEWLHGHLGNYELQRRGQPPTAGIAAKHLKIGFDRFEYGIIKRRVVEGRTESDEEWRVGHPVIFPNMLRVGRTGVYGLQIRVPVDDHNTLIWWYSAFRSPGVEPPPQPEPPVFDVPYLADGDFILDTVEGQDMMAWVTQGSVADRSTENVATSDRGVVMYRRLLSEQIQRVAEGEDPIGVVREPHDCIVLQQEESLYYQNAEAIELAIRREPGMRYSPIADDVVKLLIKGLPE